MVNVQVAASHWFDWLQSEPSFAVESVEDLEITSLTTLQMNGRFLYLKATPDLGALTAGQQRMLAALARQGDTVFVSLGPDPDHAGLSYRMPDLENAIAFDAEGLRGVIRQWFVWASASES